MDLSKRAFLYGFAVWVGLVVISLALLPLESAKAPLYESLKLTALVCLGLGLSVRYLGRAPVRSASAGAAIGAVWALTCIALDLCLYVAGAFTIGLGAYFSDVASSYLVLPVITALSMGYLERKAPVGASKSDRQPAQQALTVER